MLENIKISGFADEISSEVTIQLDLLKELGMQYIELRSADGKGIQDYTIQEAIDRKSVV